MSDEGPIVNEVNEETLMGHDVLTPTDGILCMAVNIEPGQLPAATTNRMVLVRANVEHLIGPAGCEHVVSLAFHPDGARMFAEELLALVEAMDSGEGRA